MHFLKLFIDEFRIGEWSLGNPKCFELVGFLILFIGAAPFWDAEEWSIVWRVFWLMVFATLTGAVWMFGFMIHLWDLEHEKHLKEWQKECEAEREKEWAEAEKEREEEDAC